jgi:hypothetical protein
MSEAAEANAEAEDAPSGLPPLAARRARQRLPGPRRHGAPILLRTSKRELSRDRRSERSAKLWQAEDDRDIESIGVLKRSVRACAGGRISSITLAASLTLKQGLRREPAGIPECSLPRGFIASRLYFRSHRRSLRRDNYGAKDRSSLRQVGADNP